MEELEGRREVERRTDANVDLKRQINVFKCKAFTYNLYTYICCQSFLKRRIGKRVREKYGKKRKDGREKWE